VVYEIVEIKVAPERRDEYTALFKKAHREANFAGCLGNRVLRCVEDPSRVVVIVEWESIEAHEQHRGTPTQMRFRETIGPYHEAPAQLAHYVAEDQ
jgi:quinol monooxygenase YgiN